MMTTLWSLAEKISPELKTTGEQERMSWLSDAAGLVYSVPLAIAGLIWLAARTDLQLAIKNAPVLLLVFLINCGAVCGKRPVDV